MVKIPKWGTAVGILSTICTFIIANGPAFQSMSNGSKAVNTIVMLAGVILSAFGTPPHANTPTGGVDVNKTIGG